jgi:Uma2 family endonuclease
MTDAPLHRSAEEEQIMGMPAPQPVTTIEDLLALPEDGLRHELLEGEHVVTPAPSVDHQRVVARILVTLSRAIGADSRVEVLPGPADVQLSSRTLVQPDVLVVRRDRRTPARTWHEVGVPLIAVEIVSPSTAARDREKRRLYLEAGIEEYWIVDPDARLIERWRLGDERPQIVDDEFVWELSTGTSGVVSVTRLFDDL